MYKDNIFKYLSFYGKGSHIFQQPYTDKFSSVQDTINGQIFILNHAMNIGPNQLKASGIIINSFIKFFSTRYYFNPIDALHKAFSFANSELYFSGQRDEGIANAGLSSALIWIYDNELFYAFIGKFGIFLIDDKECIKLSKEIETQDVETINIEEIGRFSKNIESNSQNFMGTPQPLDLSICQEPIYPKNSDYLLICPKEIQKHLSNSFLNNTFYSENQSLNSIFHNICELLDQKELDPNISFQLVKFQNIENIASSTLLDEILNKLYKWPRLFLNWKYASFAIIFIILLLLAVLTLTRNTSFKEKPQEATLIESIEQETEQTIDNLSGILKKNNQEDSIITDLAEKKTIRIYTDTIHYHKVKKGENLYRISLKYNQDINVLSSINELQNFQVNARQILRIPVRAIHIAEENQDLNKISDLYQINLTLIIDANGFEEDQMINPNDKIIIPYP